MYCFFIFFLQITPQLQSDFVMKSGLLVIVLSGFIIYLTILHRHKKNRVHAETKLQEERFNRELLSNKVDVQESTFKSIGFELHDNIGQILSLALLSLNNAERNFPLPTSSLSTAREMINKSIGELRSLTKSINKDWLQKFELYWNLQTEVSRINNMEGLQIHLNKMDENIPITPEQQFLLFRIIQEGIQNAVRHSKAKILQIRIVRKGVNVLVLMKDNGVGFNTKAKNTGLGISNMQQRALSLGGSIKWKSGKSGTTIIILLPIKL